MIRLAVLENSVKSGLQVCVFICLVIVPSYMQAVAAQGVFESRDKSQHALSGAELNQLKLEYQQKFNGRSQRNAQYKPSASPWNKKKQKQLQGRINWGECRDYALKKRNRCYREGRDAYRCERVYEARARLCDSGV
ncbi:hypothetical protein MNBD_GAMMA09-1610 [hydrothermal vent metagenome]|uniref:Uncharacterized protein n=1 Tax=hydrothermal vent metagenome TaxID=652676 RepID=A0A3B0Y1H5_9ZZZZ